MKIFSRIFIGVLVCFAFLGSLWYVLQLHNTPEATKNHKKTNYQPKQVNTGQIETSPNVLSTERLINPPNVLVEDELSPEEKTDLLTDFSTGDLTNSPETEDARHPILANAGFTLAEEVAFWEWLKTQTQPIDYEELHALVRDSYPLEDILESYDIRFSGAEGTGTAYCPFCNQNTFRTFVDAGTGRRDVWHCNSCSQVPKNVISFVAKMENINENQAADLLGGLLD